jgi:hypothetical protein
VLCAAGYNIRWLLRMIVKKGISHFLRLLLSNGLGGVGPPIAAVFYGSLGQVLINELDLGLKVNFSGTNS